jgi:hypothetical protein
MPTVFESVDLTDQETANAVYYLRLDKDAEGNVYFPLGRLMPSNEPVLNNRRFRVTGQTADTLSLFYNSIYQIPAPDYYGPTGLTEPEVNPNAGGKSNKNKNNNKSKSKKTRRTHMRKRNTKTIRVR